MNIEDLKVYKENTRIFFGKLLRDVFGTEPVCTIITGEEVIKKLLELSLKIKVTPELLYYTWWWRGSSNCPLESFFVENGFLYMDGDRMKVREILVQISPIPRFDFILLNIEGEHKKQAEILDYNWMKSGYREEDIVDLEHDHIYSTSPLAQLSEGSYYYKFSFNKILTAKFGAPNISYFSDDKLEIMLNKLLFQKIDYDDFIEWYNKILIDLKKKIDDFHNYLVEFPMLGFDHVIGKRIFKNIDGLPKVSIEEKYFYRVREVGELSPYLEKEMWHPPVGKVQISEGRYNHYGRSYLYLADNEETAFKEVIPQWHKTCCMAKFKISKINNILDLRRLTIYDDKDDELFLALIHYMLVYEGTISKKVENELIKNEYLVTRFLADCVRRNNFNGIMFNSTKNPDGVNLVLFNPDSLRENGLIEMECVPYLYSIGF